MHYSMYLNQNWTRFRVGQKDLSKKAGTSYEKSYFFDAQTLEDLAVCWTAWNLPPRKIPKELYMIVEYILPEKPLLPVTWERWEGKMKNYFAPR